VVDALLGIEYSHREVEWEEVMAAEPEPIAFIEDVDVALTAMADFVDIKSPWTRGHSRRVAELAGAAAGVAGLGPDESMLLARAGLVHDVGRVGVENGVWDRPGQLATAEWEKVRLHPYLTERVLSRCRTLGQLADLASSHHERMDGSGYHRQTMGDRLSMTSRILAASDVMAALTSERPQRPAHTIEEASVLMTEESRQGKLDPMAVTAVVSVAGGVVPSLSAPNPGGLSDREVEVLRLLARGRTNRQMAEELFISPKTVGRHVENIYAKIGVSTRAGAAVYAMEQRLLG
jgi:HD-GYP domain-containing protein (c-di-GMP phosphodiesterase class II)